MQTITGPELIASAFSPDGSQAVIVHDYGITLQECNFSMIKQIPLNYLDSPLRKAIFLNCRTLVLLTSLGDVYFILDLREPDEFIGLRVITEGIITDVISLTDDPGICFFSTTRGELLDAVYTGSPYFSAVHCQMNYSTGWDTVQNEVSRGDAIVALEYGQEEGFLALIYIDRIAVLNLDGPATLTLISELPVSQCIALSIRGKHIVTCTNRNEIRVFSLNIGAVFEEFRVDFTGPRIADAKLLPENIILLSVSNGRTNNGGPSTFVSSLEEIAHNITTAGLDPITGKPRYIAASVEEFAAEYNKINSKEIFNNDNIFKSINETNKPKFANDTLESIDIHCRSGDNSPQNGIYFCDSLTKRSKFSLDSAEDVGGVAERRQSVLKALGMRSNEKRISDKHLRKSQTQRDPRVRSRNNSRQGSRMKLRSNTSRRDHSHIGYMRDSKISHGKRISKVNTKNDTVDNEIENQKLSKLEKNSNCQNSFSKSALNQKNSLNEYEHSLSYEEKQNFNIRKDKYSNKRNKHDSRANSLNRNYKDRDSIHISENSQRHRASEKYNPSENYDFKEKKYNRDDPNNSRFYDYNENYNQQDKSRSRSKGIKYQSYTDEVTNCYGSINNRKPKYLDSELDNNDHKSNDILSNKKSNKLGRMRDLEIPNLNDFQRDSNSISKNKYKRSTKEYRTHNDSRTKSTQFNDRSISNTKFRSKSKENNKMKNNRSDDIISTNRQASSQRKNPYSNKSSSNNKVKYKNIRETNKGNSEKVSSNNTETRVRGFPDKANHTNFDESNYDNKINKYSEYNKNNEIDPRNLTKYRNPSQEYYMDREIIEEAKYSFKDRSRSKNNSSKYSESYNFETNSRSKPRQRSLDHINDYEKRKTTHDDSDQEYQNKKKSLNNRSQYTRNKLMDNDKDYLTAQYNSIEEKSMFTSKNPRYIGELMNNKDIDPRAHYQTYNLNDPGNFSQKNVSKRNKSEVYNYPETPKKRKLESETEYSSERQKRTETKRNSIKTKDIRRDFFDENKEIEKNTKHDIPRYKESMETVEPNESINKNLKSNKLINKIGTQIYSSRDVINDDILEISHDDRNSHIVDKVSQVTKHRLQKSRLLSSSSPEDDNPELQGISTEFLEAVDSVVNEPIRKGFFRVKNQEIKHNRKKLKHQLDNFSKKLDETVDEFCHKGFLTKPDPNNGIWMISMSTGKATHIDTIPALCFGETSDSVRWLKTNGGISKMKFSETNN